MLYLPENYAETPEGLLFIADGLNPMAFWDCASAATVAVGMYAPTTAAGLAASGTGAITGTYYAFTRFVDVYGNVSNLSPVSAPCVASNNATLTYTALPGTGGQGKVVRRQLLRNTAGQAGTFYIDVDTTDLAASTLTSSRTDSDLSSQPACPLFDPGTGRIFANTNGVPPDHKAVVAHHLGRMFAAVERDWARGSVAVTNGSTTVRGTDTYWNAALAGRCLYVVGAAAAPTILSVDVANQILTLTTAYSGPTDPFATYAIRAQPGQRRLVYYTEAGLTQSWPEFNAISLQEDGDELTGLLSKGSFLYILEKRHIYRYTFQSDPAQDGFVFLAAVRGCLNQRCHVTVEDVTYMLDEAGVHGFTGGGDSQALSTPIQQVFMPYPLQRRINWTAGEWFHAAHYPAEDTIRWFVALSGDYLPRHALTYDYRNQRWWLEEYYRPIGCSATGTYQGHRRVWLGSDNAETLLYGEGFIDGADPHAGTTSGPVTAASRYRLTDENAQFPTVGVVNNQVAITAGRGKGQSRRVVAATGTTLTLKTPWRVLPDTSSRYQLGGIGYRWESGAFRWSPDEVQQTRRVEVLFEPATEPVTMTVQLYRDFQAVPVTWHRTLSAREGEGMAVTKDSPDLDIDLTRPTGLAAQRLNGAKELYVDGPRYVSLSVSGFSSRDFRALYQVRLEGAQR